MADDDSVREVVFVRWKDEELGVEFDLRTTGLRFRPLGWNLFWSQVPKNQILRAIRNMPNGR